MMHRRPVPTKREARMVAMYRSGATLQQIGDEYGLTRERVRQLISPFTTRLEGGAALQELLRVADRAARLKAGEEERERACLAKWGMTRDQYQLHVVEFGNTACGGSPMQRFCTQRMSARTREIEWRITFRDWWRLWQESGRWNERGRGQGYCMARHGDTGAYEVGNVYICTASENSSDSWLIDHPKRKRGNGIRGGMAIKPYLTQQGLHFMVTLPATVPGKRHFGAFTSRDAAKAFGLQHLSEVSA